MKKTTLLLLILLFTTTISNAQNQENQTAFEKLCTDNGLQFKMPTGFHPIPVKENPDLHYDFAIINKEGTMEIRFSIFSLKKALEDYEASLQDKNTIMIPPNNIYKGIIQANVLNMTGGQMYDIGAFDSQAVKREFNADAGGSSFFKFNSVFGTGYEFGQFVYLHKDNVADAIVTFMSNDKSTHSDLMLTGFYALTFK